MRVILIIIHTFIVLPAQGQLMDEGIYNEIKKISLSIASSCKTQNCFVVGIGRSPAPFIEMLKQANFPAINLPLSKFRDYLPSAKRAVFYEHFDEYLNMAVNAKSKELILTDFSGTGESLGLSKKYIVKWAKSRGLRLKVVTVAVIPRLNKREINTVLDKADGRVIMLNNEGLEFNLMKEKYKNISQYPQYYGSFSVEENEDYLKLKRLIARWIKKDTNFHLFKNVLNNIQQNPKNEDGFLKCLKITLTKLL